MTATKSAEPENFKLGRDLFGGLHVYDAGGDRLTNDRMCGTEGWEETAHLLAASKDLLAALQGMLAANPVYRSKPIGAPNSEARNRQVEQIFAEDAARTAIAKALGEKP